MKCFIQEYNTMCSVSARDRYTRDCFMQECIQYSLCKVKYVEDCEEWWLCGCRSSVAEHWLHKPGFLGSVSSGCCFFFHSFNVRQSFNQSTLDWKGPCSHICIVNFEFVSNFNHDYNHSKVLIMITPKNDHSSYELRNRKYCGLLCIASCMAAYSNLNMAL